MKTMLATLAFSLLTGCGLMQSMTQPLPRAKVSTEAPAVQSLRAAVDEAYVQLIAFNRTIGANLDSGAWKPDHAQAWLNKTIAMRKEVDKVRAALGAGNIIDPENQAKILRAAITEAQRRIALSLPPE